MGPNEDLERLALAAEVAIAGSGSTLDLEPIVTEAVRLVHTHPNERNELAASFVRLGYGSGTPWEFVAACMHVLRWGEVKDGIQRTFDGAVAREDWRAIPILRNILNAFEDGWEDADLFPWIGRDGATRPLDAG